MPPVPQHQPAGFRPEHFTAPPVQDFVLPDGETWVRSVAREHGEIDVYVPYVPSDKEGDEEKPTLSFVPDTSDRKLRTSPYGIVNDDRAESSVVLSLTLPPSPPSSTIDIPTFWATLYALHLRLATPTPESFVELIPLSLSSSTIPNENREELYEYITHSGLGFAPLSQSSSMSEDFVPAPVFDPHSSVSSEEEETRDGVKKWDVLFVCSSFFQGAGAPPQYSFLRCTPPIHFPKTTVMTRLPSEGIFTVHPLRPPKPKPGTILYRRYINALSPSSSSPQPSSTTSAETKDATPKTNTHPLITLQILDPQNEVHFSTYCAWQNSERVNAGWRERGDEKHHREYLAKIQNDPHTMPVLVLWSDPQPGDSTSGTKKEPELAGYAEVSYVKEDRVGIFTGGLGDWDQGTHYLAGSPSFRGRTRFTASMTSLKHLCFLREPRTEIVVGEPRYDLNIIPMLQAYLPQEVNREFEMPHKRGVFFVLRRERFFQAAILY